MYRETSLVQSTTILLLYIYGEIITPMHHTSRNLSTFCVFGRRAARLRAALPTCELRVTTRLGIFLGILKWGSVKYGNITGIPGCMVIHGKVPGFR